MDQQAEDIISLGYLHLLKCIILANQMGWLCLLPHAGPCLKELRGILALLEAEFMKIDLKIDETP